MTTNNPASLPAWNARYGRWEGSIQDLADLAGRLQAKLFPGDSTDGQESIANVRLLRHYLAIGLMTRGERRGKEGVFALRQLLEYLAARALLRDGWPLAKIALFTSGASDAELAALLPAPTEHAPTRDRAPTRAQELVSQFRGGGTAEPTRLGFDLNAGRGRASRSAAEPGRVYSGAASSSDAVTARLATRARDRLSLESQFSAAAKPGRAATTRRTVTFEPAPWCQLTIDEAALASLDEKELTMFVERIRRALRLARRNRGENDDSA
jgi:hypothetical protein